MRRLEWDNMGVRVDGRLLHHLRFADDIILITPSISQAERMLADFDDACGKIGLQLNLTKTIFMRNGWVPDAPFSINGTTISECSSYVYLGRKVNMMNDLAPELGRVKRAAWGAYKSIEDVEKKTKNTRLRAHLFNTTSRVKRLCCTCGDVDDREAKVMGNNAVVSLSSLAVFAGRGIAELKRLYEQSQQRKAICEQRFVTVAQYIGSEIGWAGKNYSEHLDAERLRCRYHDQEEHCGICRICACERVNSNGRWCGKGQSAEEEADENSNKETEAPTSNRGDVNEPIEVVEADDDDETPPASLAQLLPSRQDSGSSKKTTDLPSFHNHLIYMPSKRPSSPSLGYPPLPETDTKLLDEFYLIEGALLLSLFRFCPECGEKSPISTGNVRVIAHGTALVVHYICRSRLLRKNPVG
ncbi:hypothetical protein ANCCEY_09662 [Ancylostoma ceylanicum]|uniref:Reverse transcriptase domain-containing protein n=1 Tax=Ancylostoma ceylanicum TaxID=53326 RepID=A0A0D6LMF0_9BILA|nr:hypothetical protein ANCCEY_09662 [Ancylostoma ceylanicum]